MSSAKQLSDLGFLKLGAVTASGCDSACRFFFMLLPYKRILAHVQPNLGCICCSSSGIALHTVACAQGSLGCKCFDVWHTLLLIGLAFNGSSPCAVGVAKPAQHMCKSSNNLRQYVRAFDTEHHAKPIPIQKLIYEQTVHDKHRRPLQNLDSKPCLAINNG